MLPQIAAAIVGGLFAREAQQEQASSVRQANELGAQNSAYANELSIKDAQQARMESILFSREMAARNEAMQREFAQMGIRWKVEDAKAAGLHPLYALGGGSAFSPSSFAVGGSGSASSSFSPAPVSDGGGLAQMGQNISRALAAAQTPEERMAAKLENEIRLSTVRKNHAEAQYWESEANRSRGTGTGPSLPVQSSVGDAGYPFSVIDAPYLENVIKAKPAEIVSRTRGDPATTAGVNPAFMKVDIGGGQEVWVPYSNEGLAEAAEGMFNPGVLLATISHNVRQNQDRSYPQQWEDLDIKGYWKGVWDAIGDKARAWRPPMVSKSRAARALERRLGIERR